MGRTKWLAAVGALTLAGTAHGQQATFRDPLVEQLAGRWVIEGVIDGQHVVHDVDARWVNAHQYLRLHEVSRERTKSGAAAYEATVYIGWNAPTDTYGVVWLDDFGGLNTQSVGSAPKSDRQLAFVFQNHDGSRTLTTMTREPARGGWRWTIDVARDGKTESFADVRLRRLVRAAKRR